MKLKHVTITGVSGTHQISTCLELSRQFPFVEWGVLLSRSSNEDRPRYPGFYTALDIIDSLVGDRVDVNAAVHLCGALATDVMEHGPLSRVLLPFVTDLGVRVQVNLPESTCRNANTDAFEALFRRWPNTHFIFQHNNATEGIVRDFATSKHGRFLQDASGGRGVETPWFKPLAPLACNSQLRYGFAGGITPDNIEFKLQQLNELIPDDAAVWIDMESGVRDPNDKLNFDAVRRILHLTSSFAVAS